MCHRWPPLLPLEAKLEALNNAFIAFILLDTTVFTSFSIFLQLYIIITPLKNTSYLLSGLCNILSHINYTSITSANVPVIDTITFMEDNFKSPRFYSIISSNEPSYRVKIRKHLPSNSKECPVKSETTLSSKKKKKEKPHHQISNTRNWSNMWEKLLLSVKRTNFTRECVFQKLHIVNKKQHNWTIKYIIKDKTHRLKKGKN